MSINNAIERLLEGVRRAPHDYHPSLATFPQLDIEKISKDLQLVERGQERGQRGEPTESSSNLDETEREIVEKIESEKQKSHNLFLDQLTTYSERLNALDFQSRFSIIQTASLQAVTDFGVEAAQGQDLLYKLRSKLSELASEREAFKKKNGLDRTAHYSTGGSIVLKFGLLMFLVVIETFINASFLAKGNELGFLGGAVEAFSFAILNVVVSTLIAFLGVREINHKRHIRKFIGILSLLIYVIFAVALNLALAHYREISGVLYDRAGIEVVNRIFAAPFSLVEIQSWIFFGIGLLFSFVAFLDGLFLDDIYPGYGKLERRYEAAQDNYISDKLVLIENLTEIRDEAVDAMEEAKRDLGVRRGEHDAILQSRDRLIFRIKDHKKHLENAANQLLMKYRDSNKKSREDNPPAHFKERYVVDEIPIEEEISGAWKTAKLDTEITNAQSQLSKHIEQLHDEYKKSVEIYEQILHLVESE